MNLRDKLDALCWIVFPGLWLLDVIFNYVEYLNRYPLLSFGYALILIPYFIVAPFLLFDLFGKIPRKDYFRGQ